MENSERKTPIPEYMLKVNDESSQPYNFGGQIKFKMTALNLTLYGYNNTFVFVKGSLTTSYWAISICSSFCRRTSIKVIELKNFCPLQIGYLN